MDFITALGEEWCQVIGSLCPDAVPHDGHEVFGAVFGHSEITPEKVHAAQASHAARMRIRDTARQWHETDRITEEHVHEVLGCVLRRWPPVPR